jgi:hypothetical protein
MNQHEFHQNESLLGRQVSEAVRMSESSSRIRRIFDSVQNDDWVIEFEWISGRPDGSNSTLPHHPQSRIASDGAVVFRIWPSKTAVDFQSRDFAFQGKSSVHQLSGHSCAPMQWKKSIPRHAYVTARQ